MSILGDRIKKERENLNLTREELAKKLDVSYSAIAMYEQGHREPSNELTTKMCKLFSCSMDYLIGNTDYKNTDEILNDYLETQYKIDVNDALIYSNSLLLSPELYGHNIRDIDDSVKKILLSKVSNEKKDSALTEYINTFPKSQKKIMKEYVSNILDYLNNQKESRNIYGSIMNIKLIEDNQFYMTPVYGRIAAGQPNWAEECIEGRLPINPELMNITNPEECYFLRVNR